MWVSPEYELRNAISPAALCRGSLHDYPGDGYISEKRQRANVASARKIAVHSGVGEKEQRVLLPPIHYRQFRRSDSTGRVLWSLTCPTCALQLSSKTRRKRTDPAKILCEQRRDLCTIRDYYDAYLSLARSAQNRANSPAMVFHSHSICRSVTSLRRSFFAR